VISDGGAGSFILGLVVIFFVFGGAKLIRLTVVQTRGGHIRRTRYEPRAAQLIGEARVTLLAANQQVTARLIADLAASRLVVEMLDDGLAPEHADEVSRYIVERVLRRMIAQRPQDWRM
jgi:hypothetical protein